MEKILQITKAPIAKIWHVLKAKAIAALEKYVSVSTFAWECTWVPSVRVPMGHLTGPRSGTIWVPGFKDLLRAFAPSLYVVL